MPPIAIPSFLRAEPAAALVALIALWPASTEAPPMQAAVLGDGFVVIERGGQRKRVIELDDHGAMRRTVLLQGYPADTRVIGLSGRTGLVWKSGTRIALAELDKLDRQPKRFGRDVLRLCEQTATRRKSFGVAWLERDGGIGAIRGVTAMETTAELASDEPAEPPTYCAVASADDRLALLWRTGDRTSLTMCGRRCREPVTVDLGPRRTILGFGCTRTECVVATRNSEGTIEARWLDRNGRVVWAKPLRDACRDTTVELVGVGTHVVIAYSLGPEPVIVLADKAGTMRPIWQAGADPDTVPSLGFAGDSLLVAFRRDGKLATEVLRRRF